MIANYSITTKPEVLEEKFFLDELQTFTPNFNAQPTQSLPVITSEHPDQLAVFNWGIIGDFTRNKAVSDKLLYAPLADIPHKASLRNSLKTKRCVILADGLYTWKTISKKGLTPYRTALNNNEPFAMAGLWSEYTSDEEEMHPTFMIITTEASGKMSDVADRVPVILNDDLLIEWLNPATQDDSLLDFLKNEEISQFHSYPINPRLKDPEFNEELLWKEVPPADQFGNLTLFN